MITDSITKAAKKAIRRGVRRIVDNGYGYGRHGASVFSQENWGWLTRTGSPRLDIEENLYKLRERSRDLYMSSSLLSAILLTLRDGVIGRGLRLTPQIDAEILNLTMDQAELWERKTNFLFNRWARSVGVNGDSFNDVLSTAYFSACMSGDCFAVVRVDVERGVKVQLIEADCVGTPENKRDDDTVRYGLKFDAHGAFKGAYVATNHPAEGGAIQYRFVPAFSKENGGILHIHPLFERPGQVRGVPIAARVMEDLKQLDRYSDAEVMAAVVSAKLTAFILHNTDGWDEEEDAAGNPKEAIKLGNGAVVDLEEGASIQTVNPARPNPQYEPFVIACSRQICSALGLPFEVVVRSFNASYSASRAALLDADKTYRVNRAILIRQLARPLYGAWMAWAVATNQIEAPGFMDDGAARSAWLESDWHGEALPCLNPVQEVQAAQMRIAQGLSTRTRESEELNGSQFEANVRRQARETALMREYHLIEEV